MTDKPTVEADQEVLPPDGAAVVRPEEQYAPVVMDETFIAAFEKGVENYKRWLAACLRATQPQHWINFGDEARPVYQLQGPGAEALAGPLGVSYADPPKVVREDHVEENGQRWYAIKVEGWIESKFLKRRGYYRAAATSLDRFLIARPGWDSRTGEADVTNKAVTHWLATATARLCGLRNPDLGLLKSAGIDIARIPRADFTGRKTFEGGAELVTAGQAKLIWGRASGQHIDEAVLKAKLKALGALNKDGHPDSAFVKKGQLDALLRWLEAGGQEPPPRDAGQEG